MRKVVAFSAGSAGLKKSNILPDVKSGDVRKFSASSIRQRVKEMNFPMKTRFRMMIRDYRKVFASSKESDVPNTKKLFYEDLLMIFSEATGGGKQVNLNKELMITSIIPSSRKLVNQLNILTRKIDKFYARQGYINKPMQIEFTKLMKSLASEILDAVYKGDVDEENLKEENDGKVLELNPKTQYRLAACAKKSGRCILFASEEAIDEIISNYEFDEDIEDASKTSLTLFGSINASNLPSDSKVSRRLKAFSSEFIPVKFIVENKDNEDFDDLLFDSIQLMNQKGVISTIDSEYNYDAELYGDNAVLFTVYFPESKTQLTKDASESNGIYVNVENLPSEPKYLFGPNSVDATWDQLMKIIGGVVSDESKVSRASLDIEDLLISKSDEEVEGYRSKAVDLYGEELVSKLF